MKRHHFLLIAFIFSTSLACAAELRIITEISPPAIYTIDGTETGKLTGRDVEIVREVQKRIGDTTPIEVMPWARGYRMAQSEPNVMLFSTTRTEARENLFQWVGPVATDEWVFLAKKGSPLKVACLADAKKVGTVGTYKDDVRELFLKEQGFTNLDSYYEPEFILRKMLAGRNDLWLTGKRQYLAMAKKQGIDPSSLTPLFTVKKAELHMAFSKGVPAAVVQKWSKALNDMKADGTYKAIVAKWSQ